MRYKKAVHSCKITCERSESAQEQRIALYKSYHHHHFTAIKKIDFVCITQPWRTKLVPASFNCEHGGRSERYSLQTLQLMDTDSLLSVPWLSHGSGILARDNKMPVMTLSVASDWGPQLSWPIYSVKKNLKQSWCLPFWNKIRIHRFLIPNQPQKSHPDKRSEWPGAGGWMEDAVL